MSVKFPFAIFITLTLILLIIIFAIWPSFSQIKKLSQAIYEQRVKLERLYKQGQLLRKVRQELKEIAPQVEELNKLFIVEGEELTFITSLEALASENKIQQEIQLNLSQQKRLEKSFKEVPLHLTLEGNFLGVLKNLEALGKMTYLLNIEHLHLESSTKVPFLKERISPKEESPQKQIQASIFAKTFWKEYENQN